MEAPVAGDAAPDTTVSGNAATVTPALPPSAAGEQAVADASPVETAPPAAAAEAPAAPEVQSAAVETPPVTETQPTAPDSAPVTQTAEATPTSPPAEAPAAAPDMQTASISSINVQMSSQKTRPEAEGSVEKLKTVYAKVIEPYDFYVKEVDLGKSKGIWYRVLVGPIPSEKEARDLCAKIKAEPPHNDCLVQLK
jgi:septal ring-binding cell division protein DamX